MIDGLILKAFLTLAVAVGAIGLLFYFLRKYIGGQKGKADGIDMKVVGKMSLQPKNHLFVIEAAGRTLLLGVSEKGINLVADLTKENRRKAGIEAMTEEAAAKHRAPGLENLPLDENQLRDALSFKSFLKSAFSGNKN